MKKHFYEKINMRINSCEYSEIRILEIYYDINSILVLSIVVHGKGIHDS